MKQYLLVSLLVLLGVVLGPADNAEAGIITDLSRDGEYLAEGGNHPWVGFMENGGTFAQSGVLIAPNLVLTTRHTTFENGVDLGALIPNLTFGFGSNYFSDRQQVQSVSDVFLHPDYVSLGNGRDLAILKFDNPFVNIPPVVRFRGDLASVAASDTSHAGFGATGEFNQALTTDGNIRGGVAVDFNPFGNPRVIGDYHVSRFIPDENSFFYRDLGMGIAGGDSGGFFGINNNGVYEMTAVNAIQLYGSAGITNIGSALDNPWIDDIIASNPPATVPEPGTFFTTGLGCAWIASRRRKRKKS